MNNIYVQHLSSKVKLNSLRATEATLKYNIIKDVKITWNNVLYLLLYIWYWFKWYSNIYGTNYVHTFVSEQSINIKALVIRILYDRIITCGLRQNISNIRYYHQTI